MLQGGHIAVSPLQRDNRPGISSGREHHIHQEAPDAAVPVHVGVDIDEYKMAKHDSHGRLGFLCQQLEEDRHRIDHRFASHRYVHGMPDIDLSIAIAGQIGGTQ